MGGIFAATSQLDNALGQSKDVLEQFSNSFLNARSVLSFVLVLGITMVLGRLVAAVLRRFAHTLSQRADKAVDLKKVNQLRRIETLTVLTAALIRMLLVVFGVYFWWVYAHPGQQPTALIGASALVVLILGATVSPILRDLAYGGVMMAEHWYGVGDHVKLEPFGDLQGVVERVTLRSTKIRGLNGEVIWISNQNIQGVRVAPKGVRTLAIDLFVSDIKKGRALIEATNMRLPSGPLTVVRPLQIMDEIQVGESLWHIVAVGETAPGREWLLEDYALRIMQEINEKHKVMQTDPIARNADTEADRRFTRTVNNAQKAPLKPKRPAVPTGHRRRRKIQ
ncbi:MAG TPA: mechanosensitive ion channel family protein [Nevskiaceae bacterium]|nr:mechanosensitive ion channel family protein [Nevskiaceae bacterium]